MPRRSRKIKYEFKHSERAGVSISGWEKFFKHYIRSKKVDLPKIWNLVSLKIVSTLIQFGVIRIPYIGKFEIRIIKAKKPSLYNDKPRFHYHKSELVFVIDSSLKEMFDRKYFTTSDVEDFKNRKLDWYKKTGEKPGKYERFVGHNY